MNSIPAFSNARASAATVLLCASNIPGFASSRLIVGSEIEEAAAKLRCSHRRSALAARITSLVRLVMRDPWVLNMIPEVLTCGEKTFNTLGIVLGMEVVP